MGEKERKGKRGREGRGGRRLIRRGSGRKGEGRRDREKSEMLGRRLKYLQISVCNAALVQKMKSIQKLTKNVPK